MELPFEKTVCRFWKQKLYTLLTREETQELRLPESMPDIGRIISSWGQVILRGKDWRGSGAGINGGVMVWVLYAPEDGGDLQRVESWIPFQVKTEIPEQGSDGVIRVESFLQGMDARAASSRKLILRAGVGLLTQVLCPEELELYIPGEIPDDVERNMEERAFQLTREAGEKHFLVEEERPMPAGMPPVEKIVYYRYTPEILEQKVLGSKAAFRGTGNLHVLYMDPDGRLSGADFDIPFAQYLDLEGTYEDNAEISCLLCVTSLELERLEEGGLGMKCGVTAQYLVRAPETVELMVDCYSPCRETEPVKQLCAIDAQGAEKTETVTLETVLSGDGNSWADLIFCPKAPQVVRRSGASDVEISGVFQGILNSPQGSYTGVQSGDSKNLTLDAAGETVCFQVGHAPVSCRPEGASWRTDTKIALNLSPLRTETMDMVTGLRLGEEKTPDPERPSVIIRRKGKVGSLWDLAKSCGSTVSAIRKMNHLEGEPDPEKLLMIPVI